MFFQLVQIRVRVSRLLTTFAYANRLTTTLQDNGTM